jgi:hypothetical protein
MGEIVNLNKIRKQRRHEAVDAGAQANRVRFGQDRAARGDLKRLAERQLAELEGKRLERHWKTERRDD